jgi:hypothetical protein
MGAVPNLGEFFWTFCDDKACFATRKHEKELKKGKDTAMGREARNTPWNLNVRSLSENRENVTYHAIGR